MLPERVINVKNLNKSFHGKPAVVDASLRVRKGEIYGFLGPNGSGKTTTIRMLCGLLKPDSGSGQCLGFDVITQANEIKKRVGYMTQKFSLYTDLSVRENLEFVARLYGMKKAKPAIDQALEELGLADRAKQLAGDLSGGWKQRLALTAALLHKPELLLLDEPTAGVDPEARREFWEHVHRLSREGITTLVSTHYMDEAERCTRLAYIAYGHMLTNGTADDIVKESALTTWKVSGLNVTDLTEKIGTMHGVDQVAAFGVELHVSGKDPVALEHTIRSLQRDNLHVRQIKPGLEDVFIALVSHAEDAR